jgi:hypothetical protein
VGGLVLGLVLAEAAFHVRDHGAFPHLNLYVTDARLGVRLRPGGSQRLAFGSNPVTSVRIGREGLRGGGLPPPGEDEVLVVGDSQVFGLGVEEGETASADLSRILGGRTVINAGVPTYGPPEYNAVLEELLPARRARTVVYVLNLANDLFEASHPNRERHCVWDGWAVRKETAPEAIASFPGRELLFRGVAPRLLREAKATCDAHDARLLVVVLPMDVQVSPAESAKYGAATVPVLRRR